jgi:arylsulfatase A-like enzyme
MPHLPTPSLPLILLALAACAAEPPVEEARRPIGAAAQPDIVVIMADDLDLRAMQTMLDLDLAPNIERYLVAEGTTFSRSFVSNSLCCPSRATMLTGQYSHNNGVLGSGALEAQGGVDALDDSSTLATWLQEVGYRTGHVGKYLNGYGSRLDDTTPSFQPEYVPPGWNHWQALIGSGTYRMFRYQINDTADGVQQIVQYRSAVDDYQTSVLTRRAVGFIEDAAQRGGPFFLEVMPVAPHAEANPDPQSRWDYFIRPDPQDEIDKPDQMSLIRSLLPPSMSEPSWDFVTPEAPSFVRSRRALSETDIDDITSYYRDRLASMLAVDDMVGEIVRSLADRGLLENTVIIFTSDNGWLEGQHRLVGKRFAYDESTRVPLYIRVPGRVRVSVSKLIANADLAPTIAELAGASAGVAIDGRSLMQFLSADVPPSRWRLRILLEHWGEPPDIPTYAGLRTGRYLYTDYFESSSAMHELYDLDSDPFQIDNVYADPSYASVVEKLAQELAAARACGSGSCQTSEAE